MAGSLPTIETFTRSSVEPPFPSKACIVTALSCQPQTWGCLRTFSVRYLRSAGYRQGGF